MKSPYGPVTVRRETPHLLAVTADTDCGAFYGQGYGAGWLRLWQLDLSRRVARGELAEILGSPARRTDFFQRRLGLDALARRAAAHDAAAPEGSAAARQFAHCQAYVAGINRALTKTYLLPVECLLLRYRPKPFVVEDVYCAAQLKYFINSAWQYELFHTRLSSHLSARQSAQLLASFSEEGPSLPPLPWDDQGQRLAEAETALRDGLAGLRLLGLASPDTGSNVLALGGGRSASEAPLLATDPHMGQVNPSYTLLCRLTSAEGLEVIGAHFPGAPGIFTGRNRHIAWGMVGLMADNQDLYWGKIDLEQSRVFCEGAWVDLQKDEQRIVIKGKPSQSLTTFGFAGGRLLRTSKSHGLFLRWPALDRPFGDISLSGVAKSRDWEEFRAAVSQINNTPMIAGYADIHGNIGLQAIGLIPKRKEDVGSLVLSLDRPEHQWQGYVAFEDLPTRFNPPDGYVAYANQYSSALFAGRPVLSNRWHPPTRALRLAELIQQTPRHTVETLTTIQDDRVDAFARMALPFLLDWLGTPSPLTGWNGDTCSIEHALLFDRWFLCLVRRVLGKKLGPGTRALYTDFWPGYRWNLLDILRHHAKDWGHEDEQDIARLVQEAHAEALAGASAPPRVEFQHTLKRPLWLKRLLTGSFPYDGGNRETIHAVRQNVDFLTLSQVGKTKKAKPYSFGPGFKMVFDLSPTGKIGYMANTPAKGTPFCWALRETLSRWRCGLRWWTDL